MWFTLLLSLDLFLAWWITSFVVDGVAHLLSIPMHVPRLIMEELNVPPGFIALAYLLPNVLLVGLYFFFQLPESRRFRTWSGWDRIRVPTVEHGERPSRDQQVIYAVCPHGIHGEGVIMHFVMSKLYEHTTVVASSLLFWIPIVRECASLAGAQPANTATIARLLDRGTSIVMQPEGLRGAIHPPNLSVLRGIPGECQPRKGFIRCAMTSSNHKTIRIVPVYMAGIDRLYRVYHLFPWLQRLILSKYMYPWPLLNFGHYWSFWPRLDQTIHVYFGKPISLEGKEVDDVFQEYVDEMERLRELSGA